MNGSKSRYSCKKSRHVVWFQCEGPSLKASSFAAYRGNAVAGFISTLTGVLMRGSLSKHSMYLDLWYVKAETVTMSLDRSRQSHPTPSAT